jgi:ankyrin repeat protein
LTDVNVSNDLGETAIHVASRLGHLEIAIELLKIPNRNVNAKKHASRDTPSLCGQR